MKYILIIVAIFCSSAWSQENRFDPLSETLKEQRKLELNTQLISRKKIEALRTHAILQNKKLSNKRGKIRTKEKPLNRVIVDPTID